MSGKEPRLGPVRQRLDPASLKPEPIRPVERLPLNDAAVTVEQERSEGSGEPARDQDPSAVLLAQSIAGGRKRGWLWTVFFAGLGLGAAAVAAWLVDSAITAAGDGSPLGLLSAAAMGLIALALAGLIGAELIALARLRSRGSLRSEIDSALESGSDAALTKAVDTLASMHGARPELAWVIARYQEAAADVPDASDRLRLYEQKVLAALDEAAVAEIAKIARRSAILTAMTPNPVFDAALVLWLSLSVIRRVARIQGLRPGLLASGALVRRTAVAMVAAGAMEMAHDFVPGAVAGSIASRVAGRVGHGAVNGFLTARLGVAALDATRPMPFRAREKPSASGIVAKAVTG